jgi:hypothetical protein
LTSCSWGAERGSGLRRLYFLGDEDVAEVSGEADVEAIETE